MSVHLHLISTPWAAPNVAPIQTACLKAWVTQHFEGRVPVSVYAPFLEVAVTLRGAGFLEFLSDLPEAVREYLSLFAWLRRYHRPLDEDELSGIEGVISDLVSPERMTSFERANQASHLRRARLAASLDRHFADRYAEAMAQHTERHLVPRLVADDGIHVVGFTLNYHQAMSAAMVVSHLLERGLGDQIVVLYGGGSASHPAVRRVFAHIGLPGFVVFGEGERKLARILELAEEADSAASLRTTLETAISGVLPVGDPRALIQDDLGFVADQVAALDGLPHPDYSDFFTTIDNLTTDAQAASMLRSICHITVEGTRGCFAKCDFCSLNRQWSGFRSKTAERVVEDALWLRRKHGVNYLHFADNVCDTWAEGYADALLDRGLRIPALMELRAHHPETFWTKLALAGVGDIQIGIEAIAPSLLRWMNKGTHVFQNLRAQKILSELEVSWAPISNLITHHPRSTLDDIAETRRLLIATAHWGLPNLSVYHLDPGSPLYAQLSEDEAAMLRPVRRRGWPESLDDVVIERHLELPASWRRPEVEAAWDAFAAWYEDFRDQIAVEPQSLRIVEATSEHLWIRGRRAGAHEEHLLGPDHARVYARCHTAPRRTALAEDAAVVDDLLERRLLLAFDDRVLALALRHRDVLVQGLWSPPTPERPHVG